MKITLGMNLLKMALGVLGGVAVVAAMCMSDKKSDSKPVEKTVENISDEDVINGNISLKQDKGDVVSRSTEDKLRKVQGILTKIAGIIGTISMALTGLIKLFYNDPSPKPIYRSPTSMIY